MMKKSRPHNSGGLDASIIPQSFASSPKLEVI